VRFGRVRTLNRRLREDKVRVPEDVSFYTITDEHFFLGTVGMLNSLRLMGHEQRVFMLDCGLSRRQRGLLESECELIALPEDMRSVAPNLLKPYANLLKPSGIAVVIDSDLLVTRPLDALLEAARNGKICACADDEHDRWFAEWEQIFDLPCGPRRQTYVNSGFLAFSVEHWPDLLPRWWEFCSRIPPHRTIHRGVVLNTPTSQRDQDALNAMLMSEVPSGALAILPPEAHPNVPQLRWEVRLEEVSELLCSLYGHPVRFVHPTGKAKPFQRQVWTRQGRSIFPMLLRWLLVEHDARVRVSREDVPVWLRSGRLGAVVMHILRLLNRFGRIRGWLCRWQFLRGVYKFVRGRLGSLLG